MDRRAAFWSGVITYVALSSLHQDAMGKERWIEFVRTGWVSGWWTIPLAAVFLATGIAGYVWAARQDKSDAKPKAKP